LTDAFFGCEQPHKMLRLCWMKLGGRYFLSAALYTSALLLNGYGNTGNCQIPSSLSALSVMGVHPIKRTKRDAS